LPGISSFHNTNGNPGQQQCLPTVALANKVFQVLAAVCTKFQGRKLQNCTVSTYFWYRLAGGRARSW